MAGAVFLEAGSRIMVALEWPMADNCSAARKRWLSEHTTTAGAADAPEKRSSVSCSKECCAPMFRNCLGNSALDNGQRRVPIPPARMTGVNVFCRVFINLYILAELSNWDKKLNKYAIGVNKMAHLCRKPLQISEIEKRMQDSESV